MANEKALHPAFTSNYYLFRRKVFKIFGGAFHVYDEQKRLLFYAKMKAFKLREDFGIFSDESMSQELLRIKTPQILDLGATYYVQDSTTGEGVGALRRKALKSIVKDEWIFLSPDQREIGKLMENSVAGALLSRFINLIPQKYVIRVRDERDIVAIKGHFNPFVHKISMWIPEASPIIDRRLIIAAGIMLLSIEGRQQ
jgi:uncharacterized protein YxjI